MKQIHAASEQRKKLGRAVTDAVFIVDALDGAVGEHLPHAFFEGGSEFGVVVLDREAKFPALYSETRIGTWLTL